MCQIKKKILVSNSDFIIIYLLKDKLAMSSLELLQIKPL